MADAPPDKQETVDLTDEEPGSVPVPSPQVRNISEIRENARAWLAYLLITIYAAVIVDSLCSPPDKEILGLLLASVGPLIGAAITFYFTKSS